MSHSKIDDPSHWLTSKRVRQYLERADKIPHRIEGENTLLSFIPKKTSRVLDLGTGDGRMIRLLKGKIPAAKCVVLDFSPDMLRALRKKFGNEDSISIAHHNLNSPLPNLGSFDVVVSGLAIHHLTDNRKKTLYSEIFSMLKPGGLFCNLDHFASSSKKLAQQFRKAMGRQRPPNRDHEERLNHVETQIVWLKKIGFVDVDCYWKWLQFALLISFKPN
jgi:tRNA (cmo5U34)-methyltransferase